MLLNPGPGLLAEAYLAAPPLIEFPTKRSCMVPELRAPFRNPGKHSTTQQHSLAALPLYLLLPRFDALQMRTDAVLLAEVFSNCVTDSLVSLTNRKHLRNLLHGR
jgi:hypothetical protein